MNLNFILNNSETRQDQTQRRGKNSQHSLPQNALLTILHHVANNSYRDLRNFFMTTKSFNQLKTCEILRSDKKHRVNTPIWVAFKLFCLATHHLNKQSDGPYGRYPKLINRELFGNLQEDVTCTIYREKQDFDRALALARSFSDTGSFYYFSIAGVYDIQPQISTRTMKYRLSAATLRSWQDNANVYQLLTIEYTKKFLEQYFHNSDLIRCHK